METGAGKSRIIAAAIFLAIAAAAVAADLVSKQWAYGALGVYAKDGVLCDSLGPVFADVQVTENGEPKTVKYPLRKIPQIVVIDGFFTLLAALNLGGMWGFLFGHTAVLVIFSILCIGIIGYMVVRLGTGNHMLRTALAFILAGALGNLYDRIFFGGVRDFLDFDLGFLHWATFNVADVWIVVGVCMVFFVEIFLKKPAESKEAPK
jgi:signal peptidase II